MIVIKDIRAARLGNGMSVEKNLSGFRQKQIAGLIQNHLMHNYSIIADFKYLEDE
jgi:hypothetical protein